MLFPQEGSRNHQSRRKREATSLRCAHACRTTTGVCHSCYAHHACTTPTRQHTLLKYEALDHYKDILRSYFNTLPPSAHNLDNLGQLGASTAF